MKGFLAFGIVVMTGAGAWYIATTQKPDLPEGAPEPTTFEECAKYYPVLGNLPKRCVNGSGVTLTQNIGNLLSFDSIKLYKPSPDQIITSPVEVKLDAEAEWFADNTAVIVEIRGPNRELLGRNELASKVVVQREGGTRVEGEIDFNNPALGAKGTFEVLRGSREPLQIPIRFK